MTAENNAQRKAMICPSCAEATIEVLERAKKFPLQSHRFLLVALEGLEADNATHHRFQFPGAKEVKWRASDYPSSYATELIEALKATFFPPQNS